MFTTGESNQREPPSTTNPLAHPHPPRRHWCGYLVRCYCDTRITSSTKYYNANIIGLWTQYRTKGANVQFLFIVFCSGLQHYRNKIIINCVRKRHGNNAASPVCTSICITIINTIIRTILLIAVYKLTIQQCIIYYVSQFEWRVDNVTLLRLSQVSVLQTSRTRVDSVCFNDFISFYIFAKKERIHVRHFRIVSTRAFCLIRFKLQ